MMLLVLLLVLLVMGVPVGWALGGASLLFMLWEGIPLGALVTQPNSTLSNSILVAVPLYILAGELMNNGGVTVRIIAFCRAMVGHVHGALAQVNILASVIFSGMSGSAYADAAGMGTVLIKAMKDEGYEPEYAGAVTAASSTIGPIIPPSIAMIIFGSLTGTSIGALFLGGIVPGLLMGGGLMLLAWWIGRRRGHPRSQVATWRERGAATLSAVPSLLMPIIIIGGILSGVFTPTEAGAVAVAYALVLTIIYQRHAGLAQLGRLLQFAALRSAGVMLVISFSALFGWLAIRERIPFMIADMMTSISDDPLVFLLMVNLLILGLGCVLDATTIILVIVPLFIPTCRELGIDLVHFGVLVVVNSMIGLITPPYGILLFVINAVTGIPLKEIIGEIWAFLAVLIGALLLLIMFPDLVLFLPRLLGF